MRIFDHGAGPSLGATCVSPAVFLGLWGGGNPGSGAKRRRTGRGQESPAPKASENKGREHWSDKGRPCPVIKYRLEA